MFLLCFKRTILLPGKLYTSGRGRTKGKNRSRDRIWMVVNSKQPSEKKWWSWTRVSHLIGFPDLQSALAASSL